jgi:AbrB family looped-hinge helix DNA binding protein
MITAKISSKGQITLPRRIRQALDVKPGERVLFVVEQERVVLRPMGPSTAETLAGSLRSYGGARQGSRETRAAVKKEVGRAAAQEG